MAIGKAFGGRKPGKEPRREGTTDDLPVPANDLAVNKALEEAVSAAVDAPAEAAPAAKKLDPLLNALQYLARRWAGRCRATC